MARARNIKPGFFQNDALGELSPLARLLFIGMWTIADFKGCLEYRPKRLKAQLLPYDECNIESIMTSLYKSRFVTIYHVQGQPYIKIMNFEKHQNPHPNERKAGSEIPEWDGIVNGINDLESIVTNHDEDGTNRADSLILIPSSLIPDSPSLIPDSKDSGNELDCQESLSKKVPQKNGTRLPEDWVLPKSWGEWALTMPGWTTEAIRLEGEIFKDYWTGVPGARGRKINWLGTWKNRIRSQNPKANGRPVQDLDVLRKESGRQAKELLFGKKNEQGVIDV
jgi:hypothetical protein